MRRRRAVATIAVEVASVVFRLRCAWPKPYVWAEELHPHFVTTRRPEVDVHFVYVDSYYRRPLPWVAPDAVRDTPEAKTRGRETIVTSSFYRARVRNGRARVTIAYGFRVDAALRALCALHLARRQGFLIDGMRIACGLEGALVVGAAVDPIVAAEVFTGFVAVAPDSGYRLHVTPFEAPDALRPDGGVLSRAVYFLREDAPPAPVRLAPARAMALAAPHLVVIERRAGVLGSAARFFDSVPCFVARRLPALAEWNGRDAA